MKALKDCKWQIEISEIDFTEPRFQWKAKCLTMDGVRFASGSVGSISCLRLFSSQKKAEKGWNKFAQINEIKNFNFKPL